MAEEAPGPSGSGLPAHLCLFLDCFIVATGEWSRVLAASALLYLCVMGDRSSGRDEES